MTEHKEKAQHWYIRRAVSYGLTISCLHDESFHEADFKERSGCHYEETLFVSQNHAVLRKTTENSPLLVWEMNRFFILYVAKKY